MSQDYFYLATIDPSAAVSGRTVYSNSKYVKEFVALFGKYADYPLTRFAMSKDQLALFFYLRCRMGGQNGVKDLDMHRVRADRHISNEIADMRAQHQDGPGETQASSVVALAQELEQVDALLACVTQGGTLSIGDLRLNSDHMTQVLKAQRAHVRAKLIANINVPSV